MQEKKRRNNVTNYSRNLRFQIKTKIKVKMQKVEEVNNYTANKQRCWRRTKNEQMWVITKMNQQKCNHKDKMKIKYIIKIRSRVQHCRNKRNEYIKIPIEKRTLIKNKKN